MAGTAVQQDIVNTLIKMHPPVEDPSAAQLEATTLEVWEMIQDFYPDEDFDLAQCYQLLLEAGYQKQMDPGKLKMVWLMG